MSGSYYHQYYIPELETCYRIFCINEVILVAELRNFIWKVYLYTSGVHIFQMCSVQLCIRH